MAIQMLRALTPATVIALDIGEDKLAFAREMGAHHALRSDASATEAVRDLTNGRGAVAVFDFVSAQATADLAATIDQILKKLPPSMRTITDATGNGIGTMAERAE